MVKLVAIACEIERGAFSGEKVFKIKGEDGEVIHQSLTPYDYCWDENGTLLDEYQPTGENVIYGKIAARVLDNSSKNELLISTPDDEQYYVSREFVSECPTKVI